MRNARWKPDSNFLLQMIQRGYKTPWKVRAYLYYANTDWMDSRMDCNGLFCNCWCSFDYLTSWKISAAIKKKFHHMESRQFLSRFHVMRTCLADENFSAITAHTITLTWISFSSRANSGAQLYLWVEPNCSPCLWSSCLLHTGGVTCGKFYIMFRHR